MVKHECRIVRRGAFFVELVEAHCTCGRWWLRLDGEHVRQSVEAAREAYAEHVAEESV